MSVAHSYSDASSAVDDVESLEMLLEAYFVVVDGTLNKLTQVKMGTGDGPFMGGGRKEDPRDGSIGWLSAADYPTDPLLRGRRAGLLRAYNARHGIIKNAAVH